ncbi:hypothetical protein ABZ297_06280 [Nonomuraea sp. NPDC005983]|uniref:hypothetical protein n=1 Tax=Nonomuraea sp. NPDC005983 TaxID=3155595 RepID=UPI0033A0B7B5
MGYPFISWFDTKGLSRIQLWWSPRCKSNWARVVQVIEGPETGWFLIGIQRKPCNGCTLDYPMNDYGHLTGVGSAWISPMLYADNIQARAGITEGSTWDFGEWY